MVPRELRLFFFIGCFTTFQLVHQGVYELTSYALVFVYEGIQDLPGLCANNMKVGGGGLIFNIDIIKLFLA